MLINKKEVNRFLSISIFFHYEGDFIKILLGGEVYNMIHLFVFMYKTVPCLKYVN